MNKILPAPKCYNLYFSFFMTKKRSKTFANTDFSF